MSIKLFSIEAVIAAHDMQLAEHGGPAGLRDRGMLESALARAENLMAYDEPDIANLAATLCVGIVKNHPFVDGNKRTGLMILDGFLELNGFLLNVDEMDCVKVILDIAAGEMNEETLAAWIKNNIEPVTP